MRSRIVATARDLLFGFKPESAVRPSGTDGPLLKLVSMLVTHINIRRLRDRPDRKLEIGPGGNRIVGFETLNFMYGPHHDYVADASQKLPFPDGTFSIIYASHVLEHIPWYRSAQVLQEWVRILRSGGTLELWVP